MARNANGGGLPPRLVIALVQIVALLTALAGAVAVTDHDVHMVAAVLFVLRFLVGTTRGD